MIYGKAEEREGKFGSSVFASFYVMLHFVAEM